MIYILAYTYVLTGLFFFLTWRAGYSFLRYILKKENFNLLVGIEIFFLGLNILFISFVTGYQLFLFLLVILHLINLVFYISGKDMKATVHCEAKETSRGKFDFRYVFVELDTWPPSKPIIVLDNR